MRRHLTSILALLAACTVNGQAPAGFSQQRADELAASERLQEGLDSVAAERYEEARRWFESAAAAGESRAKLNLGWLYEEGLLGRVDGTAAIDWYTRGVHAGESEYAIKLAWVHLQGQLATPDLDAAERWFQYAIDAGHGQARLGLGSVLLAEVMGGDLSRSERTVEVFEAALDDGLPLAGYYLGRVHGEGIGVPVDAPRALDYYAHGAAAGVPDAQWRLAQMYLEGIGTERDPVVAGKWAYLAAANGAPRGREILRSLEPLLDEAGRLEARRRAWVAAGGGPLAD